VGFYMRYWVYLNNEVVGPFEEGELGGVSGITPETMVCPESISEGSKPKWQPFGTLQSFKKEQGGDLQPEPEEKRGVGEQSPWSDPAKAMQDKERLEGLSEIKLSQIDDTQTPKQGGKEESPEPESKPPEERPEDKLEVLSTAENQFDMEEGPLGKEEKPKTDLPRAEDFIAEPETGEGPGKEPSRDTTAEIELSISKLTKAVEALSEKLTLQQMSLDEIKSRLDSLSRAEAKFPAGEVMPEVELEGRGVEAERRETYGREELGVPQEPEEEIPEQVPVKEVEPSGAPQAQVTLTTEAKKPSFISRIFKAFFVLVFILILTSVTFFFLARKGLLPEFLNPLNYILPLVSFEETKMPSEVVSPPPGQDQMSGLVDEEILEVLSEVREFKLKSGKSLSEAITIANPNTDVESIDWNVEKIDDDLFSIIVKIPPASQNDWVISYRFDYNRAHDTPAGKMLIPTNSEAQNISSL
jgi:hypothetical protein